MGTLTIGTLIFPLEGSNMLSNDVLNSLPEIGGYTFQTFLLTKKVTDFLKRFIGRERVFPHFSHEIP